MDEVLDRQAVPSDFNSLFFKNIFNSKRKKCSLMLGPILKENVLKAVYSLKCGKVPGLDGISSLTIKKILPNIKDIFTFIVSISFSIGNLKTIHLLPIHKKDSKLSCSNIKPISLISTFAKIIENVMKSKLFSFLE